MLKVSLIQAHVLLGALDVTYSEGITGIDDSVPDVNAIHRERTTVIQDLSDLYPGILDKYPLAKALAFNKI
jgi:hypothetical protein